MIVGIVPMGGMGERWAPYPGPKELVPFGVDSVGRPLVIADHVIQRMERAGVDQIVIPVRAEKAGQVMGYFGHRRKSGAIIIYVAAPGPSLIANVQACIPLLGSNTVLFGMPDTYFTPAEAFTACLGQLADGIEVVLGCWEQDNPAELDTVDRVGHVVRAVKPKPRAVDDDLKEAWGIAVWSGTFTARFRAWSDPDRPNPGFVFASAADEGLARAVGFSAGSYLDIGGYRQYENGLVALRNRPADADASEIAPDSDV